jgi:hypothetical protein
MKMKFYETYNHNNNKKYWWTQRDAEGRFAEIRKNDKGTFDLLVCDFYKSTHNTLQEAMDESKKYISEHKVNC